MTRGSSLSQAIEPFLRQMAADGRTALSIRSYRRELLLLTQALADVPLSRLTPDRLNGYLTSPRVQLKVDGTPKRASTVNRAKSVIRAFFRWCQQTGVTERNPAAHVRLAVTATPVTPHMTRVELARFLRMIRRFRHPLAFRDYALFATLAYTGIRLSDIIRLGGSDVDLVHRQLLLRRTKGGRSERRHLPARLSPILSLYIRSRSLRAASNGGPLFVTRHGRPLSPRGVQYRFAFWLRRARIQKPLSVHSLRHTFGTLLYQATKDLLLVSRALGHRDVKSTRAMLTWEIVCWLRQ
jgi:integrase/recombinase XerC